MFRAQIPMAYSSGFNPHPRISYAGAAPTGSASEAEFLELALAEIVQPQMVAEALAEALPDGLDVMAVVEAAGSSLADLLEASQWWIDLEHPPAAVEPAVGQFLAAETVEVGRMTKKGLRTFDCRAAVLSCAPSVTERGTRLTVVLKHGTPSVRPDDVLTGLRLVSGVELPGQPLLTRVAQGPLSDDGTVGDPLAS